MNTITTHIHIDSSWTPEQITALLNGLKPDEPSRAPATRQVGEWERRRIEMTGKQMRLPAGTPPEERETIAKQLCIEAGWVDDTLEDTETENNDQY